MDEYNRSVCSHEEFGMWTVYEMADRRTPGAVYKYWAQGQNQLFGRDQIDECHYSLSEISFPVCPQLVGDRPMFLKAPFVPSRSLFLSYCDFDMRRVIQVLFAR